jgi:hypothetical protein
MCGLPKLKWYPSGVAFVIGLGDADFYGEPREAEPLLKL